MSRCGYIALLGRPNAGKSTLLNALVGDKLAVVSRKPQTTRNRILGVQTQGESQLLFLDTPGLHKAQGKNLINAVMNRVALQVASEADLIAYLVDITRGFTPADGRQLLSALGSGKAPVVIIASKADEPKKQQRAAALAGVSLAVEAFFESDEAKPFKDRLLISDPLPISAKRIEDVTELRELFAERLPEGPWLFGEDDLTDMPRAFLCAELIREQLFRQLGQEIPYGTAVKVLGIEFKPAIIVITAKALVSRKSHKPILLGKGGSRIKEIGSEARKALEKHFGKKVYLDLSVGVAEGWVDDQRLIAELAHLSDLGTDIPPPQAD